MNSLTVVERLESYTMYHEFILALSGYVGDVFEWNNNQIRMRQSVLPPHLHSSEAIVINNILEIATHYKILKEFVDHQQNTCGARIEGLSNQKYVKGWYIDALSLGICEILRKYESVICDLESQVLDNPYLTLNDIAVPLESFRQLLKTLCNLTRKIQNVGRSSSAIVDSVKSEYDENIHLQEELLTLVPWVNGVLYKQITNWVVCGILADVNGEFFVQSNEMENSTNSQRSTGSNESRLDAALIYDCYLDYSMVPMHFPLSLTQKIHFIGNAIRILTKADSRNAGSLSVMQKEFYAKMEQLPLDTFRTEELCETIDELAVITGKGVHHLVVAETDLPKHLRIIKDFYLGGRGELFHTFLLQMKEVAASKNPTLNDMEIAFAQSCVRVQVQEDVSQRIKLSLPFKANRSSLGNCISHLSIAMKNEWPLHILFTKETMAKYNELFQFLLQVRLIQLDLNRIWLNTRKVFRFPIKLGPAELRNIMSHFIDHFQHYLQEDVLESQYSALVAKVSSSQNFDEIREAHLKFQFNILTQSFRTETRVRKAVDDILGVCKNFTQYMKNHIDACEKGKLEMNEGVTPEMMKMSSEFKKHMELLLNLLKCLIFGEKSNAQVRQDLGQFLLRLDFNLYFSTTITGLTLPV